MDEMTISTWQSPLFPLQFCSSYTAKNVQTKHINTLIVHSTSATTAIDERPDTKYLTVMEFEAGDFNHSGGYCYKLFFFPDTCLPCFSLLLFIYDLQTFTARQTCLLHMLTSFLPYVLYVFASWLTPVSNPFKPVVR